MNPSNASEKTILAQRFLTLIRVGFLGVLLEVGRGVRKITPCLKLVRIMLETSDLARKYAAIFNFRKYTF